MTQDNEPDWNLIDRLERVYDLVSSLRGRADRLECAVVPSRIWELNQNNQVCGLDDSCYVADASGECAAVATEFVMLAWQGGELLRRTRYWQSRYASTVADQSPEADSKKVTRRFLQSIEDEDSAFGVWAQAIHLRLICVVHPAINIKHLMDDYLVLLRMVTTFEVCDDSLRYGTTVEGLEWVDRDGKSFLQGRGMTSHKHFTPTERRIVDTIRESGTIRRDQLFQVVWPDRTVQDQNLDVQVKTIRAKLDFLGLNIVCQDKQFSLCWQVSAIAELSRDEGDEIKEN